MRIGAKIKTKGLILHLDASVPRSYKGNGTSWNDLTSHDTVGVNTNAVFQSNSFYYDGSGDYTRITRSDLNGGNWSYPIASFEFWFKPIAPNSGTTANNIFTVEDSFEMSFGQVGSNGMNAIQWASNPWAWRGSSSAERIKTDEFSQIVYIHTATNHYLYINGILVETTASSGTLSSGNGTYPYITLMGRNTGTNSPAKGNLSIVRIYDHVLTDIEILNNYNNQKNRFL